MKTLLPIILFCCVCFSVAGQQRPQFTQYFQNNYLLNPAVAGIESYTDIRLGFRNQWVGLEGAPRSLYASIQASLNKNDRNLPSKKSRAQEFGKRKTSVNKNNRFHVKPHHGIGAVAQMDQAGLLTMTSFNVSYSYHLPLTGSLNLSSGFNTGFVHYRLNRKDLDLVTPDDPFLIEFNNINKLDLGVGLWLYNRDFYVGVSGIQLIRSKSDISFANNPRASLQPHYIATAGVKFPIHKNLNVIPSVLVKMAESGMTTVDANAKMIFADRYWTGVSYRHLDAASVMAGINVNYFFDVSYSYDFTTTDMSRVSANSHEIVVGFKVNNKRRTICPEWIW
ncbi:PorP/SprF family type IX secretion system membrane protein [Rufibacter roseolus]|uniref:PorP/SprF family type IX secretion system membrane protein n=1 Tax=Rufibacter roseolus TaxID=2817375 RepID=UPI001B305EB3|nr:type IX secretion system membrane protein PorP/SprF [Rufibacter roseolus]